MSLLDVFFPKKCVGCKQLGEYLCANCFITLSFDIHSLCLVCGKNSLDGLTHPKCVGKYTIDGSFCGVVYRGVMKKLLYQFKYQPYLSGLASFLTEFLYDSLIQQELFQEVLETQPLLIPIPLSGKRQRQRGYNQSLLLAKALAKKFDLPMGEVLKRNKETKPQYGLKKEERLVNMQDAFVFVGPKGKRAALLIDDVLTTGSTFLEAAAQLKRNGFVHVYGVALARDQQK